MENDSTVDDLRARVAELEAALSKAERHAQRLEDVIDGAPALMWQTEGSLGKPGYRISYVSRQVEAILGYTREEWMANPMLWAERLHPEDKLKVLSTAPRINLAGGKLPAHRFLAKDGREVWVEPSICAIRDASGATVGRSVFAIDATDRTRAEAGRDALTRRLDNLIASVPGAVWEALGGTPAELGHIKLVSPYVTTISGYLPEEIIDHPEIWGKVVHPEDRALLAGETAAICERGGGVLRYRWITKEGRVIWVETYISITRDEAGAPAGACGVTIDITSRKLAEEAEARLKDEMISIQAATLAELGAPVIPISAEVLVMPLIGAIDDQRSLRVLEALLQGISRSRARVAILDITGVPSVDAHTADALLRAAHAARLLGAQVVLTGMRPEVAQTLVALGADLQGIVARGTLESGIAYATRGK